MMKMALVFWLSVLSLSAQAQMENLDPTPFLEFNPLTNEFQIPHFIRHQQVVTKRNTKRIDVDGAVARLAGLAKNQLALQASGRPVADCSNLAASAEYQKSLWLFGRYSECMSLANECAAQNDANTSNELMRVIARGAQCAEAKYEYPTAYLMYARATDSKYQSNVDYSGVLYAFSKFALSTQYEGDVAAILANSKTWDAKQQVLVAALIEYVLLGKTEKANTADIESFVPTLLSLGSKFMTSQVHAGWAHILDRHRYQDDAVLEYLDQHASEIEDATTWIPNAFSASYRQPDTFKRANLLYKVYVPYTHQDSWLPIEQNVFNYYEIHNSECRGSVTLDNNWLDLNYTKFQYANGEITLDHALQEAEELNKNIPNQADILTFIGALHEQLADDAKAMTYFAKAHSVCPYYNRSHWGLASIKRRLKNKAFSDYKDGLTRIDHALKNVSFPAELEKYIVNWGSLTAEAQKKMKYAMRFWANHISFLYSNKNSVFVKYDFQVMSEVPGFPYMRDVRINSGTYSRDNRLWDDVRGVGGRRVLVDIGEMSEASWGAYNLAGHEVAHQFHQNLPKNLMDCIDQLYLNAKARNDFADPYAASNESEYFAQGVSYFMIPSTSPKRYGLNEKWVTDHDPDLYKFLQDISNAKVVSDIQCPVKTLVP